MKYLFIVGIALILARGVIRLTAPAALNATDPPTPPSPYVTTAAEGPAGTVSGHVYDAKSGEQLINASVAVWGTDRGAATGIHGEYVINGIAPGTYDLYASYTGYRDIKTRITMDSLTGVRVDFWLAATIIRLGPVE